MTDYKWKTPGRFKVPAQAAGEELERIARDSGSLTAANIVNESRPEKAVLHNVFTWNNDEAAEKWREQQARVMTDNLVTIKVVNSSNQRAPVRAFVKVQDEYKPINVVIKSDALTAELLRSAKAELRAFEIKYKTLTQLTGLFREIDKVLEVSDEP